MHQAGSIESVTTRRSATSSTAWALRKKGWPGCQGRCVQRPGGFRGTRRPQRPYPMDGNAGEDAYNVTAIEGGRYGVRFSGTTNGSWPFGTSTRSKSASANPHGIWLRVTRKENHVPSAAAQRHPQPQWSGSEARWSRYISCRTSSAASGTRSRVARSSTSTHIADPWWMGEVPAGLPSAGDLAHLR